MTKRIVSIKIHYCIISNISLKDLDRYLSLKCMLLVIFSVASDDVTNLGKTWCVMTKVN